MKNEEKKQAIKAALKGNLQPLEAMRESQLPPGAREKLVKLFNNMDEEMLERFRQSHLEKYPELIAILQKNLHEKATQF